MCNISHTAVTAVTVFNRSAAGSAVAQCDSRAISDSARHHTTLY